MSRLIPNQQHEHIMQQAINKASSLIELLTHDNQQLKIKLQKSDKLLQIITHNNQSTISYNQKLKIDLINLQKYVQQLQKKIKKCQELISIHQSKLQDKIQRNKILHQKISDITIKNQQLVATLQKQKKYILSLNNQNQYLLKLLDKCQQKENQFYQHCQIVQHEFQKEIIGKDRTKQAFIRRCQEYQKENVILRKQLGQYHLKKNSIKKNYTKIQITRKEDDIIKTQLKQIEDILTWILVQGIQTKPSNSLFSKLEQIKNFVCYRLQHLGVLLSDILNKLKLDNAGISKPGLKELYSMIQRVEIYLSELLK